MTGRPTATVTCQLDLQLVVPGEATVPLPVVLRYRGEDPYAVHAEFRTGVDESVDWVFARDLVAEGVQRPAGEGDVRVWPSAGPGPATVFLALASPDGQALLQAPAAALRAFLDRTYDVVPSGTEAVDVDAAIGALLAG
ncbi:SsgA family sporulation/cell division regulator [Vallicoccus soli]|uniref:SsgA family sporulation/cell division regulator n=1 Tax=Vallicoccus soli TaxID=2339232 RepID=A0A3A3ZCS3_9ACTN|nr:SsgA family sporulation/cell division regulator [Vallicoccus soli]RJK92942.1 SsgA family sporulation/cell division regulator [Vallicoccus soli]